MYMGWLTLTFLVACARNARHFFRVNACFMECRRAVRRAIRNDGKFSCMG